MSTKRKAAAASPTMINLRPTKRQKTPDSSRELPEQKTTSVGLRFIEQLRKATDKSGRLIATVFLELPDRDELPDYYDFIKMPIALDIIEDKLRKNQYPTLTTLESDVKRMVQNAKDYNEPNSDVHLDAERVRKNTFNFMKSANPAYRDPSYKAFPTPIPSGVLRLSAKSKTDDAAPTSQEAPTTTASPENTQAAEDIEEDEPDQPAAEEDTGFKGLDFQHAQEKLIVDAIDHVNDSNELVFATFANLPSRKLEHYYKTIKEPRSLKAVLKSIHGWRSRTEQTGTTEFKSWDAFESDVAKIWQNAMEYNEDGSDIHNIATEFETYFKERLAEAKKHVKEPHASIKLKTGGDKVVPQQKGLKISLSTAQKESPAPSGARSTESPGVKPAQLGANVDAGVRQQTDPEQTTTKTVKPAGVVPLNGPGSLTPTTAIKPDLQNGVPAMPQVNGATNTMRPPSSSNSPFPMPPPGHTLAAFQPQQQGLDSKWRQEGRETLISNLHIKSHPDAKGSRPLNVSMPAHPKLVQQSVTINVPSLQSVLQASFDLAAGLQGNLGRPYRLYVTVNGQRVHQKQDPHAATNGVNGVKASGPTFDLKLMSGMNRVELECAAMGTPRNTSLRGELEVERINVYVNVLKG